MSTKKVIISSKNPVKIECMKLGFKKVFPTQEFEFVGISVPSGVSDQPMSEEETYKGAFNRVMNAKNEMLDADFWTGIEGGLEEKNGKMEAFAYIVIESKTQTGISKTASFALPQKVAALVKQGYELGTADDMIFGGTNSKQKNGSVGILTGDIITRTAFYEQSVILALIPFINPELY